MITDTAVVFAGGGVAGIAWETGVLFGLHEADPGLAARILASSSTFIGTSAGSTVAAQIAGGGDLDVLFDRQVADETAEIQVEFDIATLMSVMTGAMTAPGSPEEKRQRIGAYAVTAETVAPGVRRAVIDARLAGLDWTDHPLLIPAVDVANGELQIFDSSSGVSLVDAVTASCAVPGIWPPVEIDGRLYMDGGTRTIANLDLAAGATRILVLVPALAETPYGAALTAAELSAVADARVFPVFADDASIAAMGSNPLDPATRPAAARAGRDIGHRIAADLGKFWQ